MWLVDLQKGEGRSKIKDISIRNTGRKDRMKRKKILGCFLVFMLLLVSIMPVFAASGKTPSAVSVTKAAAAKNSVTVTWKRASNATSYRVYYKKAGARKWTVLANVSSKTTKYVHKTFRKYPLQGGKKYSYTVRAYNKYSKKWGRYDSKGKIGRAHV